ncbi:MAG TPA: cyclase family protein, partial [Vicinamibacteria bacterium]
MKSMLLPLLAAVVVARMAAPASTPVFDLARARIVDLTHPFDDKTPYWPTAPSGFELKTVHRGTTQDGYFYSAYSFCAPEHGGTHLDAPAH